LKRLAFKIRPRELRKGSTDRIYEGFRRKVIDVKGSQEILKACGGYQESAFETRNRQRCKAA